MRSLKFLLAAAVLLAAGATAVASGGLHAEFQAFKTKYGRVYANAADEALRFKIFSANMAAAAKLQGLNPLATFGVNEFADVSAAEFKSHHNAEAYYKKMAGRKVPLAKVTPAEMIAANGTAIDWRTKGAVTGVKNQGQCGSCWAFSTTGNTEGQWFLAGNTLTSFSEQLFVSCDTIDQGCNGGLMDQAWTWAVTDNQGDFVTEASYPYVSGGGNVPACDRTGNVVGGHITGHIDLPKNEDQMAAWCFTNGPVSIGVDATSWQTYTGGIMTNCISSSVDHGVLIVGFDDTNQPPYWIVKNSWGASWGEAGYIRVEKGTDQCLITDFPCSSQVAQGPTPPPTPQPPTPPPTPSPPTPPPPPPTPIPTSPPVPANEWIDLFQPPYTNLPEIIMALSCIDGSTCYVPGGSNGVGFQVYIFNGRQNGDFTPVTMPSAPLMVMAIGLGGTAAAPKGCVGGVGIGNGVQFAVNATYFSPSIMPSLLVETQDIRASAGGNEVLVVGGGTQVYFSSSAGLFFAASTIASGAPSCAEARYAAMPSSSVWYVTMGSWPQSNNGSSSSGGAHSDRAVSERVSVVTDAKTGKVTRKSHSMLKNVEKAASGSGSSNCGYTAVIAKTTDGGSTWTNAYDGGAAPNFYFNGIDCASATHCVAVGEGFNEDAAGHVFLTTDGTTFTEVLTLPSSASAAYSLMSVRFKDAKTVWIAGSKQSSEASVAVLMVSEDGGKTWRNTVSLPNIAEVTSLSFTDSGAHGFASALTIYQDSTILRYGPSIGPSPPAPGPSPPAPGPNPPSPPTPTGTFIQEQCSDAACTQGCTNNSFSTGTCLQIQGGGSAIVTCTATALNEQVFSSSDCTGTSQSGTEPLDQCLQSSAGGYFENFCTTGMPPKAPKHVRTVKPKLRTTKKH